MDPSEVGGNKTHRAHRSGAKADKRKAAVDKKKTRLAEGTGLEKALENDKKSRKDMRVRAGGERLSARP